MDGSKQQNKKKICHKIRASFFFCSEFLECIWADQPPAAVVPFSFPLIPSRILLNDKDEQRGR